MTLGPLLQLRLGRAPRLVVRGHDGIAHRAEHELARRVEAAVHVHGTEHRLVEARSEADALAAAGLRLTPAEPRALRESELLGDLRERRPGHELGPQRGELPLGSPGVGLIEQLADHEVHDGVAQELKSLEVRGVLIRVLVQVRAVGERHLQQSWISEPVPADLVVRHDPFRNKRGSGSVPLPPLVAISRARDRQATCSSMYS